MKSWMGQPCEWAHLTHLTTCLWMVSALIQTGEVNLTRWIPVRPMVRPICTNHTASDAALAV
ncbi:MULTISPECIES: hypothetical protein [unclassified Moorena]|uniref:hypothetical protein n=1 Tax=unclassified Moorena TaxID=2683338 RepID=UPI0013F7C794|nr:MULTISPECIES: hypothetical protein [unclassified Moorena]NEO17618.1 hypothetical protein [Moorena sp. SIO3E8]NEP29728.1 hypothetical protein [Moorena sp. SIO3I6]NEQ04168.1 hypothetical protein [Moorena sp. SIO3F7]